jgi:sulfite exporter TauE/SafE/copper chaperone CopZ
MRQITRIFKGTNYTKNTSVITEEVGIQLTDPKLVTRNSKPVTDSNCYEFYVEGMHCAGCELFVEENLSKDPNIKKVRASLRDQKVLIEGNLDNVKNIEEKLTSYISSNGYSIVSKKISSHKTQWEQFILAVPIALFLITVFLILQKFGIVDLVNTKELTPSVTFFIGIAASLSTCMAVVGSLVLSISANYEKESRTKRVSSQVIFHLSRLVSFFLLGGLIGILGATISFNDKSRMVLDIVIALILFILGINLLEIFPIFKKFQPRMPRFISKKAFDVEKSNKIKENSFFLFPILLGALTFFLPCGFTQSIQATALQSGDFLKGATTMFIFALGTLPVLALLSFASVQFSKGMKSGVFFKIAGIVVLFFAMISLNGALI